MKTSTKLGAYALGLAAVFGTTFAVGGVGARPRPSDHVAHVEESARPERAPSASIPGGLQVSENGYTFTPLTSTVEPDKSTDFRFSITGPDGRPVTDYQVQHDKKLHFIVVSRDLAHFQHLHPTEAGGGVWSVPLTLPSAGVYRMFADFAPEGGKGMTLGADLHAAGDYTPEAPPSVARTATVDGYTITLNGDLVPGQASRLVLTVSKDGKPVTDLQPYLGAYGHLVALREGDLAYLHVHPDGEPGDGKTPAGPEIVFYAEIPSRGNYRLFLDFQHSGEVRTADFALDAGVAPADTPSASPSAGPQQSTDDPSDEPASSGHGEHTH